MMSHVRSLAPGFSVLLLRNGYTFRVGKLMFIPHTTTVPEYDARSVFCDDTAVGKPLVMCCPNISALLAFFFWDRLGAE